MVDQLLEISKGIGINVAAVVGATLGYFKIFLQRIDDRIEKKKKNIEIIDSIIDYLPQNLNSQKESILKLSALEKFNAFYNVKFDFETMVASLNTEAPQKTIQVIKSYKKNIRVENGLIKPIRILDDNNKKWKIFFYMYIIFSSTLSIFGLIYPNMFSFGKELTIYELVTIRSMYIFLIIFLLKETWKLRDAKNYIKSIS